MVAKGVIVGVVAGALAAATAFAMPAIGAPEQTHRATTRPVAASFFTPASADPKLAALVARSGFDATPFRFTPADSRGNARSRVDLQVRARSVRPGVVTARGAGDASAAPVGLAPIAYNLGASVAWKRFQLSGDLAKVDLAGVPGSRKSVDIGVSYAGRRASARLQAHSEQPLAGETHLVGDVSSYSIDVGGSYSLTKSFDVTAGVRYKSQDRDRLTRLGNDRQDSQAVYVGTAFKF